MKKVILERPESDVVYLNDVDEYTPIFAKKEGKLIGMLVKEKAGWILRVGGSSGATGCYDTREEVIESCLEYGYTFHAED